MKRLLFIPVCFISFLSIAQDISFTQGAPFELPKKSVNLGFFYTPQGLVNFSIQGKTSTTDIFNPATLAKTDEKINALENPSGSFNNEMIVDMGGSHYWLHSTWNSDADQTILYFDKVDPLTGQVLSADNKMFEASKIETQWTYEDLPGFTIGNYTIKETTADAFNIRLSPDHKKMLLHYIYKTSDDVYQTIGVAVFDEHLNKIWSNEFVMPVRSQIVEYSDYAVDNKGNAYCLAITEDNYPKYKHGDIVEDEADKNTGKANYHYILYKFSKDSKTVTQTEADPGNYFLKGGVLIQDIQNKGIYMAASYSKAPNVGGADGLYIAKINEQGAIEPYKKGFYEFPADEAAKFASDKTVKRDLKAHGASCPLLRVNNLAIDKDGGLLIAAEDYGYITDPLATDGYHYVDPASEVNQWFYFSIYAMKINASGDLAWAKKLPKKQQSFRQMEAVKGHNFSGTISYLVVSGPVSMGYKLISTPSGYYFIYMDNPKNDDLSETNEIQRYADGKGNFGGELVATKIDNTGKETRQVLTIVKDDIEISPTSIIKVDDKTYAGRMQLKEYNYAPFTISLK
jgi:hypothetical protein